MLIADSLSSPPHSDSRPNLSSNIFKEDTSFSGYRSSLVPYEQQLQQASLKQVSSYFYPTFHCLDCSDRCSPRLCQERECRYWVAVIITSPLISSNDVQSLLGEVGEIQQMLLCTGNWYFIR